MAMAGTITMLAGAIQEVLPSPVGTSPIRAAIQRPEEPGAVETSARKQDIEGLIEGPAPDKTYLASILERAQKVGLSNSSSLSFERDATDGKMYLYIRDKRTGDEIIRIPKKYLEDAVLNQGQSHRVDVRI
jgi:uncharacterized FlaG/YvyC family protein